MRRLSALASVLAVAAALAVPSAAGAQDVQRFTIPATVYFCNACTRLSPEAKAGLQRLRAYARGARLVRIRGYASPPGSRWLNLELSRRRAVRVAYRLLAGLNPHPDRISVRWYGEKNALPSWARSRRVEILIVR